MAPHRAQARVGCVGNVESWAVLRLAQCRLKLIKILSMIKGNTTEGQSKKENICHYYDKFLRQISFILSVRRSKIIPRMEPFLQMTDKNM